MFFNYNGDLVELFQRIYAYQNYLCSGEMIFDDRQEIIGLKKEGEHLRLYFTYVEGEWLLRLKTLDAPLNLRKNSFEVLQRAILFNNNKFNKDVAQYTLQKQEIRNVSAGSGRKKDNLNQKKPKTKTSKSDHKHSNIATRVLSCLSTRRGLKAVEIAERLGVSRAEVNACLYGELAKECYQDGQYKWFIVSKANTVPSISQQKSGDIGGGEYNVLLNYAKNKKISFDDVCRILPDVAVTARQLEEVANFLDANGIKIIY